jgi:hypothetical protein
MHEIDNGHFDAVANWKKLMQDIACIFFLYTRTIALSYVALETKSVVAW